jgi:hypothetical protein
MSAKCQEPTFRAQLICRFGTRDVVRRQWPSNALQLELTHRFNDHRVLP